MLQFLSFRDRKSLWRKIELKNGDKLIVSPEHRVYVAKENQYSKRGVSSNLPVLGSTLNPKVSRTTTPNKTLLTKSEIQTSKGVSLFSKVIHAFPLPTLTSPAPVETTSS